MLWSLIEDTQQVAVTLRGAGSGREGPEELVPTLGVKVTVSAEVQGANH